MNYGLYKDDIDQNQCLDVIVSQYCVTEIPP